MVRYVYGVTEGGRDMAGPLGGKGAERAEMTRPAALGTGRRRQQARKGSCRNDHKEWNT